MSSSYVTEPATRGQLILHTTKGPIDIVLWPKEAPLATRNLIQLALDGYYDGCIFHRLIPGFILQGGDPTGTGHGGESSTGNKLPIETHQRLKFNRRGLVALADGFSQFFITLDKTPELDGKHTLMGKVVGDTLFNVLDMANAPVDANERPTNPVRIERVEVVDNPFEDVVPRANVAARAVNARLEAEKRLKGEQSVGGVLAKKPTKRTRALLSFGEDEEDQGDNGVATYKKAKKKPKKVMMSAIDAEEQLTGGLEKPPRADTSAAPATSEPSEPSSERFVAPALSSPPPRKTSPHPTPLTAASTVSKTTTTTSASPSSTPRPKPKSKPSVPLWQQERDKYLTASRRAKSGPTSDSAILDKLAAFKSKLAANHADNDKDESGSDTDASPAGADQPPCLLHSVPGCLSCSASFGVGLGNVSDKGWMTHKLKFAKDYLGKDVTKGKALEDEMYMVIDPREELRKGKDKDGGDVRKAKNDGKGSGQSWRDELAGSSSSARSRRR